ncbi:ABC transporter substrate-binding protein [Oricola thermophila]|uniref:ABC transporter substrate-binding protein n=2 Tax=Oricola thermophila TaxID=2742145 RepID=A0A6N1VDF1_9HYPH|nr:ABC transporter substrate-binding protein [Oricola thermophila]
MRFYKCLMAAAATLTLTVGAAQAQDMMKIRIGTEGAYPPFNNLEADGTLTGFDIDIAKALCAEMNAECEFVTQDWDGIIPALLAGKFDAIIASMSITEERMEKVDFTDHYYTNSLTFAAAEDADLEGVDPASMAGKTVGVQEGTISAQFLEENYPNTNVNAYPTQLEAYADLKNGRSDAVLADFGVLYDWINSDDGQGYDFFGEPVSKDDKIGIAVRKGEQELKEKFNAALESIRANGTYAEINKKYFPFDIY